MLLTRRVSFYVLAAILSMASAAAIQIPLETIGPRAGTAVPEFEGVDQFGRTQTLQSILGPQGAMLVFFRSADW
jgi:hypothetical protein